MRPWIKFYTEALHDRKMRRLDRFTKSVFYDLLLLAGFEDNDGYLPCIEDIAFELDLTEKEAKKSITKLLNLGVISQNDNGFFVTMFADRQDTQSAGYERVKRYREKKKSVINDNAMITDDNVINDNAMITTDIDIEEDIDKDIEKEIDKEEEKKRYTCASAQVNETLSCNANEKKSAEKKQKSEKAKLKPEDDDFWNFAKDEKSRAQAFYKATGFYPTSRAEFGRWQKDLPKFTEVGISIDAMVKAIEKIQSEGKITIAAPGSVFTTARNIANQRDIPKAKESWTEIAERIESEMAQSGTGDFWNYALPDGDVIDL